MTDKPSISGLIIAGSADLKNELADSDILDSRLKSKILQVVTTKEGGENGLNQAIGLAQNCLKNNKFAKEKIALSRFYEQIERDSNLYAFGVKDTLEALEMGAVDTLLLHDKTKLRAPEEVKGKQSLRD